LSRFLAHREGTAASPCESCAFTQARLGAALSLVQKPLFCGKSAPPLVDQDVWKALFGRSWSVKAICKGMLAVSRCVTPLSNAAADVSVPGCSVLSDSLVGDIESTLARLSVAHSLVQSSYGDIGAWIVKKEGATRGSGIECCDDVRALVRAVHTM
jgi:hypothetical protein